MNTDTHGDLAPVLFGVVRLRLLKLLLLRPDREIHLREISRLIETQPGTVRRELALLTEAGLVKRRVVGNQVHFQADASCPVLPELTLLVRKLASARYPALVPAPIARAAEPSPGPYAQGRATTPEGRALANLGVTRRSIAALCRRNGVRKLSLFGSVTRSDFRPGSDVDVLVEFQPDQPVGLGRIVDLRDELESLCHRTVDVATPAILRNPHRKSAILRDLRIIYEAG
jgi:predicted nucleotidyltransferase/DNA-binding transcriptional ArsR family regulator